MPQPFHRLKFLPWVPLLQVAAITAAVVAVAERLLNIGTSNSTGLSWVVLILFSPPLQLLGILTIGMAVGALAVWIAERWYPQVSLNNSSLWALVVCLILMIFVKTRLPGQFNLVTIQSINVLGMIIGVFLKARPYIR